MMVLERLLEQHFTMPQKPTRDQARFDSLRATYSPTADRNGEGTTVWLIPTIAVVALAIFLVWALIQWIFGGVAIELALSPTERSEIVRNVALIGVGFVGLVIAAIRSKTAFDQVEAQRKALKQSDAQHQISQAQDRFSLSIDGVSNANPIVQRGSVMTLANLVEGGLEGVRDDALELLEAMIDRAFMKVQLDKGKDEEQYLAA